jgi:hypothetical protein
MLFLDGVYIERHDGSLRFRWVQAPTSVDIARLTQALALRIGRYLERQGLLERDADDCMDAGGTSPRMDEVGRSRSQSREQRMEQLPRTATWLATRSNPARWNNSWVRR